MLCYTGQRAKVTKSLVEKWQKERKGGYSVALASLGVFGT
jgi:hypothetical protein